MNLSSGNQSVVVEVDVSYGLSFRIGLGAVLPVPWVAVLGVGAGSLGIGLFSASAGSLGIGLFSARDVGILAGRLTVVGLIAGAVWLGHEDCLIVSRLLVLLGYVDCLSRVLRFRLDKGCAISSSTALAGNFR